MQPTIRATSLPRALTLLVLVLLLGVTATFMLSGQSLEPSRHTLRGGANREAGGAHEQGKTMDGLSAQDWFARGETAQTRGDIQGAINAWQTALQRGAPPAQVYPRLAGAHHRLGNLDRLAEDLRFLASDQPADPAWQYQLGLVQALLQPEAAHAHLVLAAELDPHLAPDIRILERGFAAARLSDDPAFQMVSSGRALAAVGQWQLAEAAFTRATLLRPDYAEAWAFLGEARRQTGKDGFVELQKAVTLDRHSISANTLLGLYWQQSGRLDLALVYLDAAVRLDRRNPVLQTALGSVLAQQGNLPAALVHYQRAAEMSPRDPTYWRALANFTIEYETQVREVGLPAARSAVLLDSTDPASLDTMAQIYVLLGNPGIAHRFLKRALVADPGYAPARLHLGLVLLLDGNSVKAREQFHLAQALAPVGSTVEEQTRRLLLNLRP